MFFVVVFLVVVFLFCFFFLFFLFFFFWGGGVASQKDTACFMLVFGEGVRGGFPPQKKTAKEGESQLQSFWKIQTSKTLWSNTWLLMTPLQLFLNFL